MSATRLLMLGALRFMQPAHGYSIRQQLEAWQADQWANVAFGSIYFALKRMAEEGLLEAIESGDASSRPARIAYVVTERGEEEFQRLLHTYWWERKPLVDPFLAAVAFMSDLSRDELIAALRFRIRQAQGEIAALDFMIQSPQVKPRHVAELLKLTAARLNAEVTWATEAIDGVERGELP